MSAMRWMRFEVVVNRSDSGMIALPFMGHWPTWLSVCSGNRKVSGPPDDNQEPLCPEHVSFVKVRCPATVIGWRRNRGDL
jgi:hypothetical protein